MERNHCQYIMTVNFPSVTGTMSGTEAAETPMYLRLYSFRLHRQRSACGLESR